MHPVATSATANAPNAIRAICLFMVTSLLSSRRQLLNPRDEG
jgi:hypothetical protein